MKTLATRLDLLLDEPQLTELVGRYFDPTEGFAGHLFDEVGENPPVRFDVGDLLAITLLDVALGPRAVRSLLEEDELWTELLQQIPVDRPLWDASDAELEAAQVLWERLIELPGVGPTKAGKLLARKRPQLIPIYDDVVGTFLQPSRGRFWLEMRDALDDDRRKKIDTLGIDLPSPVSTLRLVDVAVWMRCGSSQNAVSARANVGLPQAPLIPH